MYRHYQSKRRRGKDYHRKPFGRSAGLWQQRTACRLGSPGSHLGFSGKELQRTLDNFYYDEELAAQDVILSRGGLHLIPAGEPLAYAEQKLSGIPAREKILTENLYPIQDIYDYIIIDCPPNLGFLTINAVTTASDMLVVIKPEYFALEGLRWISKTIKLVQKRLNPKPIFLDIC